MLPSRLKLHFLFPSTNKKKKKNKEKRKEELSKNSQEIILRQGNPSSEKKEKASGIPVRGELVSGKVKDLARAFAKRLVPCQRGRESRHRLGSRVRHRLKRLLPRTPAHVHGIRVHASLILDRSWAVTRSPRIHPSAHSLSFSLFLCEKTATSRKPSRSFRNSNEIEFDSKLPKCVPNELPIELLY